MNKDITPILEGWDYKSDQISVRKIKGSDGKEKIQLRISMGLRQMEVSGRPDGRRPYGKESLLEYYLSSIEQYRTKYGTEEGFGLDSNDCAKLQCEAIQYYYRYLSLLSLEEYEGVERDTQRNLNVFDFVRKYAVNEDDKWEFQQYRPYVIMMNTKAKGSIRLQKKDYKKALQNIEKGILEIECFFREYKKEDEIETSWEIAFLKNWAEDVQRTRPQSPKADLEEQLKHAVANQEFEKAAQIRDKIRKTR